MTTPIQVLIVGAGEFGLSTALHLLSPHDSSNTSARQESRKYSVTILERHPSGLAPDAASMDLNKIVRSDYPDLLYARFAREAIRLWKEEGWEGVYHENGVLVLGDASPTGQYTSASLENSLALGCRIVPTSDEAELRECFPPRAAIPSMDGAVGYVNKDGGWVEAERAMRLLRTKVESLGGVLLGGRTVSRLSKDEKGEIDGVVLSSGEVTKADLIVLATGAWTPSLFPELGVHGKLLATGQSELFLHLEEGERERWRGGPVVLDWSAGMSIFEPTADGIVKIGLHHAGFVNPLPTPTGPLVSTPSTSAIGDTTLPAVPVEIVQQMRAWLGRRYPELGKRSFVGSRMCWYTDTPDGDWLIDFHPEHPRVVLATGGSGHAFKFLPKIGALVRQRIERTLPSEWATKLAWKKEGGGADMTRVGEKTEVLAGKALAALEDLVRVGL